MAHRTRKRLTKTELKKDPVNEALLKGMAYVQDHVRQLIIAGIALIVVVLVVQAIVRDTRRQADSAAANLYLAGQIYLMGLESLEYGEYQMAVNRIETAHQLAASNYARYPGRRAGRRSAILAAKTGIMLGMETQVIADLQDLLAADPDRDLTNSASLHLAVALENRAGAGDLSMAMDLYEDVMANAGGDAQLLREANSGLSRVHYALGNYEESYEHLETAISMFPDTTDFHRYHISRLEMALR